MGKSRSEFFRGLGQSLRRHSVYRAECRDYVRRPEIVVSRRSDEIKPMSRHFRVLNMNGEGARKLITIEVSGAPGDDAAERIARSIANSLLVKTAIAGSDPNWGRILSAAGNAGLPLDPLKVDIDLQEVAVCRGGLAADFSESDLKKKLNTPECLIRVILQGRGKGSARFWTCDLTEKYIEINASYRT